MQVLFKKSDHLQVIASAYADQRDGDFSFNKRRV